MTPSRPRLLRPVVVRPVVVRPVVVRPVVVRAAVLALLAGGVAFRATPAQRAPSADASPGSACLDSVPADALTRLPVYLVPHSEDAHAEALRPVSDLFTSTVGERMRAILGATPERLPEGGHAIGWRDLGPGLSVTLHRDGTFGWELPSSDGPTAGSSWLPPDRSRAATDSLARALATLREEGERHHWPEEVKEDRLTLRLSFDWQTISGDGRVEPLEARFAVPVLSAAMPHRSPVVPVSMPQPQYPHQNLQHGVTGTVILQFVVDARGGVDERTIRDLWVGDAPRPRGEGARLYRGFVRSVRSAVARARFEPATMGGCPVPQLVQQPFVFGIR